MYGIDEEMIDDVRKWLKEKGEEVLREVGISEGQIVLDFGCGSGNYAIPAAKIVGKEGVVYALDKDRRALDKLMRRALAEGLKNLRRMDTSEEVEIGLDTESVDVVLLYDIFWYFPLEDNRLTRLMKEVYRISKPSALVSVLPKHIHKEQLKDRIENAGFQFKDKFSGMVIHYGSLEDGEVLNFIKKIT